MKEFSEQYCKAIFIMQDFPFLCVNHAILPIKGLIPHHQETLLMVPLFFRKRIGCINNYDSLIVNIHLLRTFYVKKFIFIWILFFPLEHFSMSELLLKNILYKLKLQLGKNYTFMFFAKNHSLTPISIAL